MSNAGSLVVQRSRLVLVLGKICRVAHHIIGVLRHLLVDQNAMRRNWLAHATETVVVQTIFVATWPAICLHKHRWE